ncbi:hypothetical protein MKW92_049219, partial [Papaver armeniacum]
VINPTGRCLLVVFIEEVLVLERGGVSAQRGKAFMRGGVVFSTSGRGNMHRMMDWLGTPEQWENDE